jgi:molybdopterin-guanine dinucleotide biosynthesis protein A
MVSPSDTLGVVLAGGRSSRMGQNKALLKYKNQPLIEHMMAILNEIQVSKVVVSGEVIGYESVPDPILFQGPAQAMVHIMQCYPAYRRYLFTPVDMPFLTPDIMHILLQQSCSAYFEDRPLPALIFSGASFGELKQCHSVKDILLACGAISIPVPDQAAFTLRNLNTPEDWQEAITS